jgi:hypothetical protein
LIGQQGSEPCFPVPDRFIAELITTNQEHPHQIAQTQLEEQPKEYHLKNNIGWHLQKIKRCAGSLVEATAAIPAVKNGIPEIRPFRKRFGLDRLAMRTIHASPHRSKISMDAIAWDSILTDPLNGHYTFHSNGKIIDLDAIVAGLDFG